MGRKRRINIADRMQATKFAEEQLRPALPATISANSTWLSETKTLLDTSPEVYSGVVARLADGDTVPSIAKLTGLDVQLIRKIRELHPEVIEAGRRAAYDRIGEALQNASQRLADNIDAIPVGQLPIAVGVLVDKVQLLSGGATSRIEHSKAPSPEDLKAMFDALPAANVTLIEETTTQ